MPKGIYLHKPLSEETKRKLSMSHKGKRHSANFSSGHIPWNKGKKWTSEVKKKISETNKRKGIKPTVHFSAIGVNHPFWKGQDASYSAIHHWLKRMLGKPSYCKFCKKSDGRFEWANKSHEYKRELTDWVSLCYSCHDRYDNAREKMWQTIKSR